MEGHYLDKPSLVRLSHSINNHGDVPDKNVSTLIGCDCLGGLWDEDRLSERRVSSVSSLERIFSYVWLVVHKVSVLDDPVEEDHVRLACRHNVLDLMRVESDIMLHLCLIAGESRCHERLDQLIIVDLPN